LEKVIDLVVCPQFLGKYRDYGDVEGKVSVPRKNILMFDTSDPDELSAGLAPLFGRARIDRLERDVKFHCQMRYVALADIGGIVRGRYAAGMKANFPDFNAFVQGVALNGASAHRIGRTEVTVPKGGGVVVSPGNTRMHFGTQFEHISVSIRPAVLIGKLAAIVGNLRLGPLQIDPAVDCHDFHSKRLERLMRFVATEVESSWPMPSIMQLELQQAIMVAFLLANNNNYSGLLYGEPLPAGPWQVRRAEQFVEANWNQPITIEALVAATGVSARSLFSSFKAARGCSPMDFVKRVRLGHAWQELSRPDSATSVSTVAFECGFGNLGHFAGAYRRYFGELPSETLKRGKGK